jgi:primosomal protein N' (replication factor Y) (superfamily II helicase)
VDGSPPVARVLPDVTGLDKEFDYLVPDALTEVLDVGDRVRVTLHGRRVGAWVVGVRDETGGGYADVPVDRLLPIQARSGLGPDRGLVELAGWAAHRWAGRRRSLLVTASPPTMVKQLPAAEHTVTFGSAPTTGSRHRLVRRPPTEDPVPIVQSALAAGPVLVVVPNLTLVRYVATQLRGQGCTVAVVPEEWARAAAGVDVVVGARSAAWARCGPLGSIILIDEHDEALQEERNPTWHARDVLCERADRLGVPLVVVSPCPSVVAIARFGPPERPSRDDERAGWPRVEVVDRTDEEPWRRSLVTGPLQVYLRDPDRRVVCVLNTKGRARLLACVGCRELQRCDACGAAVMQDDDGRLTCPRCGTARPTVCPSCGASAMRVLRPGVTRLREELEAAARRPVVAVEADGEDPLVAAGVYVGTEAVLHRVHRADVVAFLDLDAELLAPRYRAAEQAMALLARAARMVGPRARDGRVLVQTFLPDHEVLRAVLLADPGRLAVAELQRREALRFPPVAALATLTGSGADEMAASMRSSPSEGVEVMGPSDGTYLVRAVTWELLADVLAATPRPARSRVRVEVDPPRR